MASQSTPRLEPVYRHRTPREDGSCYTVQDSAVHLSLRCSQRTYGHFTGKEKYYFWEITGHCLQTEINSWRHKTSLCPSFRAGAYGGEIISGISSQINLTVVFFTKHILWFPQFQRLNCKRPTKQLAEVPYCFPIMEWSLLMVGKTKWKPLEWLYLR